MRHQHAGGSGPVDSPLPHPATVSQALDLLRWDLKRNSGPRFDAVRARMLLAEVRLEQLTFTRTRATGGRFGSVLWKVTRFIGSVYQWALCGSYIPGSVALGRGLRLPHPQNIVVVATATIGEFATLYQNTTVAWNGFDGLATVEKSPRLGDCVLLGAGAIVLGNVSVGDYVLVGAGAVVTRDVPRDSRVTGNPGKVVHRPPSGLASQPGSAAHMRDPYSIYR